MGRPPNPHGRRGAEAAKKQFVVPIPPVEPRLQAMVESNIASTHPWLVQRAQLDQAESHLQACQTHVAQAQRRVQELQTARNSALHEIATLRQGQLESSLEHLQQEQRREFAQQQEAQRNSLEFECHQLYNTSVPPHQEEEEPPSKKMKIEEGQEVDESIETKDVDKEETKSTVNEETVSTEQQEPKPSDAKRKQLEEAERKVEELTEQKHEMIWLLKQVIKAEQKQKIQKKASATDSTKAT